MQQYKFLLQAVTRALIFLNFSFIPAQSHVFDRIHAVAGFYLQ